MYGGRDGAPDDIGGTYTHTLSLSHILIHMYIYIHTYKYIFTTTSIY
jgi:hypothetical protein